MYQHVHICTLQLIFKYQFNWIYNILKYQKCKCTLIQYDLAIWTCTLEKFDFRPLLYVYEKIHISVPDFILITHSDSHIQ